MMKKEILILLRIVSFMRLINFVENVKMIINYQSVRKNAFNKIIKFNIVWF